MQLTSFSQPIIQSKAAVSHRSLQTTFKSGTLNFQSMLCNSFLGILKLTGIQSEDQRHSRSRGLHHDLDQDSRITQGLLSLPISSISFSDVKFKILEF